MTSAPTLTPTPVVGVRELARGKAAVDAVWRGQVEVLEAALAFAQVHRVTTKDRAASWGGDSPRSLFGAQPIALAGRGAPRVDEFAPVEWAAATGTSHEAALALLADVLDLSVRLPQTWALTRELRIPVHVARLAAQESRDLDQDAAAHADRLLAWKPSRLNPHRVGVLVHEARLYADPDRAVADHDAALASRHVHVHHDQGAPGTSRVDMLLDTNDAVAFDRTVSHLATTMATLGHHGSVDVRRAHAVGVLASPQRALDLIAGDPADPDRPSGHLDPEHDPAVVYAEDIAFARANPFRAMCGETETTPGGAGAGSDGAEVTVVVHITDRDLIETGPFGRGGVARTNLGPVMLNQLSSWLACASKVTIKPVLDPATIRPIDAHDPSDAMADYIRLRDETCVFPGCRRSSSRADLDHITPYLPISEGGSPGQTSVDNLAPLCRRHHRAKTFGEFTYERRPDGSYRWTMPSGITVTTDPATPRPRPQPRSHAWQLPAPRRA